MLNIIGCRGGNTQPGRANSTYVSIELYFMRIVHSFEPHAQAIPPLRAISRTSESTSCITNSSRKVPSVPRLGVQLIHRILQSPDSIKHCLSVARITAVQARGGAGKGQSLGMQKGMGGAEYDVVALTKQAGNAQLTLSPPSSILISDRLQGHRRLLEATTS